MNLARLATSVVGAKRARKRWANIWTNRSTRKSPHWNRLHAFAHKRGEASRFEQLSAWAKSRSDVVAKLESNEVVEETEEGEGVDYRKQGDLSNYTAEALSARDSLRKVASVVAVLEQFWQVLEAARSSRRVRAWRTGGTAQRVGGHRPQSPMLAPLLRL